MYVIDCLSLDSPATMMIEVKARAQGFFSAID
jgi:hypothetical protein